MLHLLWMLFRQVGRWVPGFFRCLETVWTYRPAPIEWKAKAKKVWRYVLRKLSPEKGLLFRYWFGQKHLTKSGVNHSASKAIQPYLYLVHHRILT